MNRLKEKFVNYMENNSDNLEILQLSMKEYFDELYKLEDKYTISISPFIEELKFYIKYKKDDAIKSILIIKSKDSEVFSIKEFISKIRCMLLEAATTD